MESGYRFSWDPRKVARNIRKHRVSFDEASTVFGDPVAMRMPDPDHSVDEDRYVLLGMSGRGRLLVVTFVERSPLTRLISARPATRQEQMIYADK